MAGNALTIDFAGDAKKLQKAAKESQGALGDVEKSAKDAGKGFEDGGQSSGKFLDKVGKLGSGITGLTDAVDNVTGGMQALIDIQDSGKEKATRQARALADVEQAMLDGEQAAQDLKQAQNDLNQAFTDAGQASLDAEQAQIDKTQATLDAETAQKDYNKAVKEHGKNSAEARQALIDVQQAQADVTQADLDAEQAKNDLTQANSDYEQATLDAAQATRDGKDAQLDLNEAQREANPSELQQAMQTVMQYAPLLTALASAMALVEVAQWAWNAAQLASPTTWIVLAIVALIAVIVLIVTHLDTVKKVWGAVWGWIKDVAGAVGSWFKDTLWGKWIKGAWDNILGKAQSVWNWMKGLPGKLRDAFSQLGGWLFAPFRAAFNRISDAWNNTIGRLSWSVPSWVPGVGGNSISVPHLPKFHTGGVVPGVPGAEVPIMALAGEEIVPRGGAGGMVHVVVQISHDVLIDAVAQGVRRNGGLTAVFGAV